MSPRPAGLATRFALSTAALAALFAAAVALFAHHRAAQIIAQEQLRSGLALSRALASGGHRTGAESVLAEARQHPSVAYAAVLDETLGVLESWQRSEGLTIPDALPEDTKTPVHSTWRAGNGALFLDILAPIPGAGARPAGFVRVGLEQTDGTWDLRLLLGLIFTSIGMIAPVWLLAAELTRRRSDPIQSLTAAAHKLAEGHLSSPIAIPDDPDLAELAHSFEELRGRLAAYRDEAAQNQDALEREVEQRTAQLIGAVEEARELAQQASAASRAKSQFLANISHEIRTPMNAVLGMSELLLQTPLTEVQHRFASTVHSSARSLLGIINDILNFSKAEAGRLELDLSAFDLNQLLEAVVGMFAERAKASRLDLGYVLPPEVPVSLQGDVGRLRQILVNLVSNALKFTDEGGVLIRVGASELSIRDVRLRFEVLDTGIGIPQDQLGSLFEPFVQLDGTMSRQYGGTGLGLAICKQLVEAMGGEIGLESTCDEGSRFWFELPFETATCAVIDEDGTRDSMEGLRVLIVEDNAINREILEHQLRRFGLESTSAETADAGYRALRDAGDASPEQSFDLAIIDMKLGESNGLELARRLRRQADFPVPPLIMLSSLGAPVSRGQALASGFVAVLTKPVRSDDLYACLSSALGIVNEDPPGPAPEESSTLSGRVLLVEDNEVNQLVAQGMLESLGCDVVIASGGEEALKHFRAALTGDRGFDLIFMDCQMPGLDGLETTEEIRALELEQGLERTPVIALTAHTARSSKQACEEVGMDDYMSKPFSQAEIRQTLERWLPRPNQEAEEEIDEGVLVEDEPPEAPHKLPRLLDHGVLASIRLLEERGQEGLLQRVAESFDRSGVALMEQLRDAFVKGDPEALRAAAHTMVSSAANVGARQLSAMAKQIERQAGDGAITGMGRQLSELESMLGAVRSELREVLGLPDPAETRAPAEPASAAMSGDEPERLALIIDDDESTRQLLRGVLSAAGFAFIEARGGAEGLQAFERHQPDVVLLDVMMKDIDGFDTCEALRSLPRGASVPVLFMTGLDDPDSIHRAYEVGATDFITKPIAPEILQHRVRYLLRASDSHEALRRSQAHLARAQKIAGLGNWVMDLKSGDFQCSEEARRIMGLDDVDEVTCQGTFRRHLASHDRPRLEAALNELITRQEPYSLQYSLALPGGRERAVQEQGEVLFDQSGRAVGLMGTVLDITDRTQAEEEIQRLAYYDGVTGLVNRTGFMEAVADAIERGEALETQVAVIFLDLDRFKRVNDSLGHAAGDELLKRVSRRLHSCLESATDIRRRQGAVGDAVLARFGGDVYTVLLPDLTEAATVEHVAEHLRTALERPFVVQDHELVVTASQGISMWPSPSADLDALLKDADAAMNDAKHEGGNQIRYASAALSTATGERFSLEADLRRAIERQEFEVYYQPRLNANTEEVIGAEALVRWNHPLRGRVSPGAFIPLAEETGLIVPIGEWVLREACGQYQSWLAAGLPVGRISVNLSVRQFRMPNLCDIIQSTLDQTGLSPESLELEVTESMVMRDVQSAAETMRRIQDMGIHLALDDFGTGHASLNYLRHFPINTLKVDQSFVRNLGTNTEDTIIASVIISLGKALSLNVVAEGVETERQLQVLRQWRCDELQGYLYSKPLPASEFETYIRDKRRRLAS